MIYIIDRSSVGDVHVMFNAAMIKVFQSAYPGQQMIFFGEESHISYIKHKLSEDAGENTTYCSEAIIKSTASGLRKIGQWIKKLRADYKFMNAVLKKAQHNEALVYFCSIPPISIRFLASLSRKYNKVKIINTLHGELETVFESHGRRERMIGNIYKHLFKETGANLYHLLLNKISKPLLIDNGYLSEKAIIDITHPYFYQNRDVSSISFPGSLKLGHVGSLGVRKNGQLLYNIAERFKKEINEQKILFSAVGAIEPNVIPYKNEYVKDFASNGAQYLDRNIFEQKISELDYALFFYGPDQFIFRASGAIFDVIEYGKPIIVLKHAYFEYLFKEAGNIGFICDSLNEMEQLIQQLLKRDSRLLDQYPLQQKNIAAYRHTVDIPHIAYDLKKQLSARNILNN